MLKIRSLEIFNMGIPTPGEDGFYIEMGPSFVGHDMQQEAELHNHNHSIRNTTGKRNY